MDNQMSSIVNDSNRSADSFASGGFGSKVAAFLCFLVTIPCMVLAGSGWGAYPETGRKTETSRGGVFPADIGNDGRGPTLGTLMSGDLTLYPVAQAVSCDSVVDVPVKASRFRAMLSMQGGMQWDSSLLRLESVSGFGPSALGLQIDNFGVTQASRGRLFFSWNDPTLKGVTLIDSSTLFVVRFVFLKKGSVSATVSMSDAPVRLEFIDTAYKAWTVMPGSAKVEMLNQIVGFNPLPDTSRACGKVTSLNAGPGFSSYSWNTGASTQVINPVQSGLYRVTSTNAFGCTGTDRTYLNLIMADILNRDTIVCRDSPVLLVADRPKGSRLDSIIVPGDEWEYTFDKPGEEWKTSVGGWQKGLAPFGNFRDGVNPFDYVTLWPVVTKLYVRKRVNLQSVDLSTLKWYMGVDNGYTLYLNGRQVSNAYAEGFTDRWEYSGTLPDSLLKSGDNYIAVELVDNGGLTAFDMLLTAVGSRNDLTYRWSTGDSTGSVTVRPSRTTTYFLSVSDGVLTCSDSVTVNVSLVDTSLVVQGPLTYCATKDSVRLLAGRSTSIQWLKDGVPVSGATGSSYVPDTTGVYRFVARNETGCIDSSRTVTVTVLPIPKPTLTPSGETLLCEGDIRVLTATDGKTYRWYRNDTLMQGRTSDTLRAVSGGRYAVEAVSDAGCSTRASNTLVIQTLTKAKLAFAIEGVCADVDIRFVNRSQVPSIDTLKWNWRFGDGTSSTSFSPTKVYADTGRYVVRLAYSNPLCPTHVDSLARDLLVIREKSFRFPNVNAVKDLPKDLLVRDTAKSWIWRPATGLSRTDIYNPKVTLKEKQEYLIETVLRNGCIVYDTLLVKIADKPGIYVPKAFSPNNDGQNDRLFPITLAIAEIKYFRVYNRWGNLMYESRDMGTTGGWDGTYKGVSQPMETFVWVAEGVDVQGKTVKVSGNVLLLR